ncbi:MAG TPA: cyclic nucleotide-binding domain-containing protein [Kofleriaceae bacterium]|nr:cyclic nucleotide-binding domain-containing protein [Kofleriaceae bacterium]
MTVTADDLVRATQKLRLAPTDWGAWLEVAAVLGALGATDEVELAFATIGEGARVTGRVALAVACGRHLAELGSVRGPELIEQVIDTYATGGPHFAFTTPPSPEDPPAVDWPPGEPLAQARAVIEELGAWLMKRQPTQVPPAPLLSALSKPGARALVGVMTAKAYPAMTPIIDIGAPATQLYWIAHGTVTVSRPKFQPASAQSGPIAQLGELHSGAFFGEIALVGGTKRTANVIAAEDVWLLEIPARALETAAQKHPQLAEVIAFHARARLLSNVLRTSELFKPLDENVREELLGKFSSELIPQGMTFIRDGEANDALWVIVSGTARVSSGGAPVAELQPGSAVGEMSLVSGAAAGADVTALEPLVLLKLAKKDFDAVVKRYPTVLAIVEKLAKTRQQANQQMFQDASDLIV